MNALDAHQHFWQFDPVRDAWIDDSMAVLQRDFMPDHLQPILNDNGVSGCIAVQADTSWEETNFLLDLADQHRFIEGVVGWADLADPKLGAQLDHLTNRKKLRGFRHILQGERPEFMLRPEWVQGLRTLGERGYTYDILVFPGHLGAVKQLLRQVGGQPLIIDHLAKPYIRRGLIKQWRADLRQLARHQHLYMKLSGMVTEADWEHWNMEGIRPYFDVALDCFGTDRLVYGSDWPVCLLAADYGRQLKLMQELMAPLSIEEQHSIFSVNGRRFYHK